MANSEHLAWIKKQAENWTEWKRDHPPSTDGSPTRYSGVVKKKIDKGFGFLTLRDQDKDLFLHSKSLINVTSDELNEGDEFEFDLKEDPRGITAERITRKGERLPEELQEEPQELQEESQNTSDSIICQGVRMFSRWIASQIARDPSALYEVEWRTLEHVIAEVFDSLGFAVTLTPSSKDGGKDVILECEIDGRPASYLVEIKHWGAGKRVGGDVLRKFLNVVVRERRSGGLFLSTSGYSGNALADIRD